MPPCHGGGRGFEPRPDRHFGSVAQSVEQRTENPRVAGSIPALGTLIKHIFDIEMGLKIPLLRQECFGSGIFFIGNCVL